MFASSSYVPTSKSRLFRTPSPSWHKLWLGIKALTPKQTMQLIRHIGHKPKYVLVSVRGAPRIGSLDLGNVWQHAGGPHLPKPCQLTTYCGVPWQSWKVHWDYPHQPIWLCPPWKLIYPTLHRILYPQSHKPKSPACCLEMAGKTLFYPIALLVVETPWWLFRGQICCSNCTACGFG